MPQNLKGLCHEIDYSEIRCIALRVLQTSKGFWVYLFCQPF